MDSIDHMVGAVLSHLSSSATSRAVAGEPIKLGDVTLVVLSMLSVGMGAGGGEGQGGPEAAAGGNGGKKNPSTAPGTGEGSGAGGAVRVRPAAVIAFTPGGVEVLSIPAPPGPVDRAVERVPEIVGMLDKLRQSFQHAP